VILKAYGILPDQADGLNRVGTDRYDITAEVPPGTTLTGLRAMLQNLLKDRFGLVVHHETRPFAVYELVLAKNGPKLERAARPSDSEVTSPPRPITVFKDGFPDFPPGRPTILNYISEGVGHLYGRMQSLSNLAEQLTTLVGRPVLNNTGLTEMYDFKMTFAPIVRGHPPSSFNQFGEPVSNIGDQPSVPEPSIFDALQKELGLRLQSGAAALDVIVIDQVRNVPTDN
jgi:uncharacterized protein (TIGR03435 family)